MDSDGPVEKSDIELLDGWIAGELPAGNELVHRYFDSVRKYFANAVSHDDLQDLTQDTFRKLTQSKHKFERRSSFRTYLFGIARNTLRDYLRARYRGKGVFDPLEQSVIDHGGVRPSQAMAEIERHHALLTCVRALPVGTKQMLELYYWQDFTARELAVIHELEYDKTVSSRLAAARSRLAACLGRGDGPDELADLETQLRELAQFFESGPLT
jgi:RNA polymerase sigma-70 factor (ECF subfamily)